MDVPPRLLHQDRADFERALSHALADAEVRAALSRSTAGLGTENLRALARASAAEIAAAASSEYDEYARLRAAADLAGPLGGWATDSRSAQRGGGGLMGALAVLAPILAGSAAVILYLIGYLLSFVESRRGLADSVIEAAWTAAIVSAASAFAGVLGLLLTAGRQRAAAPAQPPSSGPAPDELLRARDAWRTALVVQGVVPFLLARLDHSRSADSEV